MNEKLEQYKGLQQELMRQIQVTMKNKALLQDTLKMWQEQLKYGSIDAATYTRNIQQFLQGRTANEWQQTYDNHIKKCNQGIVYYTEKINEVESPEEVRGSVWSKVGIVAVVLLIFFTFLTFSNTNLTGFFLLNEGDGRVVHEDGFASEGIRWAEIKGNRFYERCLQIKSEADFTAAKVTAKATRASEEGDLVYTLHKNKGNEPGDEVGSCKVNDYEELWKSCTIKDIVPQKGEYWICAGHPEGKKDQTYFTIAYRIGGDRRTALWTGQSWQKLDRSSYTIKVQFMNNE